MPEVRLELDRGVATLVLDNPDRRNALTPDMIEQLGEHVATLAAFDGVGLVLRGEGTRAFSAGADLEFVRSNLDDAEAGEAMCRFMQDVTMRIRRLPLVSVSAIEGGAFGGGAELTTCTDFRVMSRTARIQFVHARLGLVPGWGGAVRLTRLVGRRTALELLAFSRRLNAQQARSVGLVEQLCPPGQAEAAAKTFLQALRSLPPESVRAAKSVVSDADHLPADEALDRAATRFRGLWGGPAIRAVLEG
ncbi:MAG: enoyl-CoA hydratase/isomerase family protein [Proteobacteria bacterium]|nr:enoyl-CoA hydratase/isomerase family protein [Pseudomonadota bacterium]MCP4920201.1 enoyl-CoA hydratase/isomerase family protein [Pseudomonadota bacterium]